MPVSPILIILVFHFLAHFLSQIIITVQPIVNQEVDFTNLKKKLCEVTCKELEIRSVRSKK
jgi:energy-converting hydrogenase Eha subunit H